MLLNSDEMILASQQEGTSKKLRADLDKNLWRWLCLDPNLCERNKIGHWRKYCKRIWMQALSWMHVEGIFWLGWIDAPRSLKQQQVQGWFIFSGSHLWSSFWGLSHFVTWLLPVGRRDVRTDELISELVVLLIDQSFRNLFSLFICTKLIWGNTQQLSSGFKAAWVLPVESLHVWLLWFPPAAQS